MGGDFGPRLCVPAALKFLHRFQDYSISLVGQKSSIELLIADSPLKQRIDIVATSQIVDDGERPGAAYRHKRQSSMWKSLELLADDKASACVSAGNTGALMAMSRHLVKTIDGMSRPAICKPIPTAQGDSYLIDMGANLNCSPGQLLQFALMGGALAKVNGRSNPSVALLNVGEEITKGNEDIQRAYVLLDQHPSINFHGFIEGDNLYAGLVDVVVCDGFVGNVALKISEGAASFILSSLKYEFTSSVLRRVLGALNFCVLRQWRERFNPSKYNGAALLGLKKTVIKSHGGADADGFFHALLSAKQQMEADVPYQLQQCLTQR